MPVIWKTHRSRRLPHHITTTTGAKHSNQGPSRLGYPFRCCKPSWRWHGIAVVEFIAADFQTNLIGRHKRRPSMCCPKKRKTQHKVYQMSRRGDLPWSRCPSCGKTFAVTAGCVQGLSGPVCAGTFSGFPPEPGHPKTTRKDAGARRII